MEKIVILGYGGHAKSIVDSIYAQGMYDIAGYTDMEDKEVNDIPYLGNDTTLRVVFDSGIHLAVFGMGYMGKSIIRDKLHATAKEIGFQFPTVIDPTAVIAKDVQIGEGTYIGKRAVINAAASIGKMCIINTGAIIEHENIVGDFTHIAVGATLCGNVHVADHCMIGANSTVIQGVTIGSNSTVGAGSVVLTNIADNETFVGVPAKAIRR